MICLSQADDSWTLIRQPDHAQAAAQIARHWLRPEAIAPSIWPRVLDAVAHHDDGWQLAERHPPIDESGHPCTFQRLPDGQHAEIWRTSVDLAAARDPYVALLVALHARWLVTNIVPVPDGGGPAVQAFVDQIDTRIGRFLAQLTMGSQDEQRATEPHTLDFARQLLSFVDLLSLVLVGALPANDWPRAVAFSDQVLCVGLTVVPAGLALEPWPFACETVGVDIRAFHLGRGRFDSPMQLAQQLAQTQPISLRYTIFPG